MYTLHVIELLQHSIKANEKCCKLENFGGGHGSTLTLRKKPYIELVSGGKK